MAELTMKYRNIVWIVVLILLSSFVTADLSDGLTAYWTFDVNADADFSSNDGTVTDATHRATGGANDGYYFLDAQTDKICFPNSADYNFSRTDPFTISIWINSSTGAQSSAIFGKQENAGVYEGWNIIQQTGNVFTYFNDKTGNTITKDVTEGRIINGQWQHLIFKYNGTSYQSGMGLYWNGTYYADSEIADTMNDVAWNDALLCVGARDDNTGFGNWVGSVDEIGIWNRNLSDSEILELETAFYPFAGATTPQDLINVSIPEPTANSYFSTNSININLTANSTDNFDAYLYLNSTLEDSTTFGDGVNVLADFDVIFADGNYSYYLYCEQIGNASQNETTASYVFTVDTTPPVMTTNINNGSVYMRDNFTAQINLTDNFNVFAYNISIDGVQIEYTGVNRSFYVYNWSYNISSLSIGQHTLTIITYDGLYAPTLETSNDYNFYVLNYTTVFEAALMENEEQTMYLYVNKTTGYTTSAGLVWNGSQKTITKTSYSTYDMYESTFVSQDISVTEQSINFTWSFNITNTSTYEFAITNNQTIYQIGIDNCSTYTMQALNITLWDEDTLALVAGDIKAYFQVWINSISDYRPFNITWGGLNTYGLCINPNWTSYIVYTQFEYSNTNYDTKYYYFTNKSLNNVSEDLFLYFTNSTTDVTFTVTDENDNAVSDAYISILKYDVGTNSYITTEIIKTDSEGVAIGSIVLNDKWYKFIINYDGEIVLETAATKVTSTTVNFQIDLTENFFDTYDIVDQVSCDITFNSVSKTFSYTYSDPSGSVIEGCFNVIKRTLNSDVAVNSSCVESASSTILLSIGNATDGLYVATGNINIDGTYYVCGSPETKDYNTTYSTFGLGGVFVSFLIVLTLIMVGIWHPVVAVFLMIIGVIATNIIGIFHLTYEILISFVIIGFITIYRLNSK